MNLPIINDEIGEHKLMRIEQERCNTQREDGDPEIDEVGCPERQGHIEKHDQCPHPQINAGPSEARKERAEVDSGGREATTGCDIPSTTEGQIAKNRMGIDLRSEDLEDE